MTVGAAVMPDRESHFPGTPSQPNVPATGDPPPASSSHAVQTGAVAVAALVFVVGGLAWAYHLVQQRGTQPASRPQQTPPVSQSTTPGGGLQGDATGQQAPGTPAGSEP